MIKKGSQYKIENGQKYKLCSKHEEYFPNENTWFPCTEEYFYKNNTSKEGLSPYCKKCTLYKSMKWRVDNRDKWLEHNKKINSKPDRKEEIKTRKIKLREEGQERIWQQNNKNKIKIYNKNRQHKNHNIANKEWESCKKYFNYECAYCGSPLKNHYKKYRGKMIKSDFHKEHVNHEGSDDLSNCVPSCHHCNSQKWKFELNKWYNEDNPIYIKERYDKIIKWITRDYKQFIERN